MSRRVLCCLAVLASLTGCALLPRRVTPGDPLRHYRGVVLDANTRAPIPRAVVTAEYHYFGTTYLLPAEYLGYTLTREDGTFDLALPVSQRPVNHLEAHGDFPSSGGPAHRHGQTTAAYNGQLNHVSAGRTNTILVR